MLSTNQLTSHTDVLSEHNLYNYNLTDTFGGSSHEQDYKSSPQIPHCTLYLIPLLIGQ